MAISSANNHGDLPRLTKMKIVDLCKNGGQRLCVSHGRTETRYSLEPSGHPVGPKVALEAVATGLLTPGCDGLFGTSDPQTWIAR
jgi:hypothetical protein